MKKNKLVQIARQLISGFTISKVLLTMIGTAILSFGIYNIHQQTNITEGGVLGMILLVNHWFGLPSSIIAPILDLICYALAFKYLGKTFIKFSVFSSLTLAGFFSLWEHFPPMLPDLSESPLLASILGGIFVGVGVGLVVRQGGSSGGDDALALTISKITSWRISRSYLITDLTVLILSLTYISFERIVFSLITVTISSYTIDFIQNLKLSQMTSNQAL